MRLILIALVAFAACKAQPKGAACPEGQSFDQATLRCIDPPSDCSADGASGLFTECAEKNRVCQEGGLFGSRCARCLDGYKEDRGVCRPAFTCADLGCAQKNRVCVDAGPNDDAKCTVCVDGAEEQGTSCVVPSCAPSTTPGSILSECEGAHRVCTESNGVGSCGACEKNYTLKRGECVPVLTCSEVGCGLANRLCVPQSANADASCAACRGGYAEVNGICLKNTLASCSGSGVNAIASTCDAQGRDCISGSNGDECGGCVVGKLENSSTLLCEDIVTCASLACGAENRECESLPNGRCTECKPGFVEDRASSTCRPVVTCSQLTCPADEACIEAGVNTDARCQTGCAQGSLWNGTRCEPCPPCNGVGENGRLDTTTLSGACICKTNPGYFYSLAADVGTFACDADGDGWVRESARNSLESNDPLLRTNARCELRKIDRVVLRNELLQEREVLLDVPLSLYETDRNDDDQIFNALWSQRGLPSYGASDHVTAASVNRLTKLCHHPRADYNDNGVPDVEEFEGSDLAPGFRADQRPFNVFSYFAELHTGRYEPPTSGVYGRYRIEEKSRLTTALETERVAIEFAPADPTHWRECSVLRDSAATTQSPAVGMDFAKHADTGAFTGMHHHSQFKCVVVDAQPIASKPWTRSPSDVVAQELRLNRCELGVGSAAQTLNPTLLDIDCQWVDGASAQPGDVRFAGVTYTDYGPGLTRPTYLRGCVNDCILSLPECPFYDVNPSGVSCDHDENNFGAFLSCAAFEVCDGLDNDGVNGADDGNPGGGVVCTTTQPGRCAPGHTNCVNGAIECTPDNAPIAELCNNIDDNCVDGVDDNNPQGNANCTLPNLLGVCRTGTTVCQTGGNLACIQTTFSSAEVCGNALDENCDGTINEGENNPGCVDYYYDFDGDGFGIQASKKCLCAPDTAGRFTARAKNAAGTVGVLPYKFDCCDSDNRAVPGATTWRDAVNACSSWDYDCNGLNDAQYTDTSNGGCGVCCSGFCCCDGRSGWADGLAGCGSTATWYTGSCGGWSSCPKNNEQRFQRCR